jgi:hypothetical protein
LLIYKKRKKEKEKVNCNFFYCKILFEIKVAIIYIVYVILILCTGPPKIRSWLVHCNGI